jgi:hypothetical protein
LDLENWCRQHPEYLEELQLAERAQLSLKLLEASGKPQDLSEAKTPWWKTLYMQIGLAVVAVVSLFAFWVLFGKYVLTRSALDDARQVAKQGALIAPQRINNAHLEPDRAPGLHHARVSVSHTAPEMLDLKIALGFTNNIAKDSNGDVRLAINTTGLTAGEYSVRIDGLPFRGEPLEIGWVTLSVM